MKRWSLTKQYVLITGAASGIGRELAVALAQRGNHLWLWDCDKDGLLNTVNQCQPQVSIRHSVVDLGDTAQVQRACQQVSEEWPELTILINNAGIGCYGAFEKFDAFDHQHLMQVNLLSPMLLTHSLLPVLLRHPRAHVVNVSSMYGLFISNRSTSYHASKFGMVGFGFGLRAEYRRTPLRVNTICPGFVKTELYQRLLVTRRRTKQRLPPSWACSTVDQVVSSTIRAIESDKRLVLIGQLARLGYLSSRFAPGLIDWMYSFGKRQPPRVEDYEPATLPIGHGELNLPAHDFLPLHSTRAA